MSGVTSNRRVITEFAGVYSMTAVSAASENTSSPGSIVEVALSSGNNTITPPTGAIGATVLMPEGNTALVTLKGVNGDTGIALALTDPTSLGLHAITTFVLNAASSVTVQIIWS